MAKKRRAPEYDDQAFRKTGPICGPNKKLINALTQKEQAIPANREDIVDARYNGDKVVSFKEKETGIDYKVVDSFSHKSLKKGVGREDYCIIQQSHGDRFFALLKYNPITEKWIPTPIKFDVAADDWTEVLDMFFTKNFTIIPGGIKYQLTNSCKPIIENKIWSTK